MPALRFSALLCCVCALCAQTPTIDQALSFKTVGGARISPDGKYVAYTVNDTNWEENAFEQEIWIASLTTGERYQLTNAKKSSQSPMWSPDGKRLAFISDRDGKRQIYTIAPAGGEPLQLTSVENGVGTIDWSPDGAMIAFTATPAESKAQKERKEKYGEYQVVNGDYAFTHLWTVKTGDAKVKPEQLTQGEEYSVGAFSWSPDSKQIAFSAAKNPDLSMSHTVDIHVVRVADRYVRKLVDSRSPDRNPVWSPDGREIAYETAAGKEFYFYLNSHIAVVPADGGAARVLTTAFDENPQLLDWGPAGIYFSALQRTEAHLFRLDPATQAIERISRDRGVWSGFSFTKDFGRMSFTGAPAGGFREVYTATLKPFESKPITTMADQFKEFKLATREVVEWKSSDGTQIEGVLIKPADYDAKKKYPLLVVIHGGPTGIDVPAITPERTYPLERFAAKGALILRPNYRGSAGYGEKFRSLNVRNLGVGDAWDVISGVDHLIARGMVDRERVGAMGWSQGGYISAFLTTSSDRFRAISVGAGISNWMTYYVNTDIHPFTRQYLKATPWDDPEIYRKTSPISYVKTAKTPTLIQHGENDRRVPIPNAFELHQALEDRGVPVKLVVYKGFGHGIDKPKQQRSLMEQNYDWFSQWIWGEKPPAAQN